MKVQIRIYCWFLVIGPIGVLATILIVVLATTSSGGPAPARSLSDVPGFRTSPEGMFEDDMIALWEAFNREQHVQECMDHADFDYTIEVAFPAAAVLQVAQSLNLTGSLDSASQLAGRSDSQQAAYVDTLTKPERNQYFLTLSGETAEDVARFDATGELPEGRNEFARSGCYGAVRDALPGLYKLRRELIPEVIEEKARESTKLPPCVTADGVRIKNLQVLEEVYELNGSAEQLESCEESLVQANEMARKLADATVFSRHKVRLIDQDKRYRSALDEIESDREFLKYLDGLVIDLERELAELSAVDRHVVTPTTLPVPPLPHSSYP